MTTEEAVRHFGGVSQLAKALNIDRRSVWKWGAVPPRGRQCELEIMTGGALRADKVVAQHGPETETEAS